MQRNTRRVQRIHKTFINEIRRCLLRRQKNNPANIEKDINHFTPQRTPGKKQNVCGSKALLVAETNKGDTKNATSV